jgi:hypothetical protein
VAQYQLKIEFKTKEKEVVKELLNSSTNLSIT